MKKLFNEILSIIQNTSNNRNAQKPSQELKFIANHPSNHQGMTYLKPEKQIGKDYKELFSLIVIHQEYEQKSIHPQKKMYTHNYV